MFATVDTEPRRAIQRPPRPCVAFHGGKHRIRVALPGMPDRVRRDAQALEARYVCVAQRFPEPPDRASRIRVAAGKDHIAVKTVRPAEAVYVIPLHGDDSAMKTRSHVHPAAPGALQGPVQLIGDPQPGRRVGSPVLRRQQQACYRHGHGSAGPETQLDSSVRVQQPAVDFQRGARRAGVQIMPAQNIPGRLAPSGGFGLLHGGAGQEARLDMPADSAGQGRGALQHRVLTG